MSVHVVDKIEGDYVHMTCSVGKVVGQLTNYNIGWRAWLMKPTDAIRKAAKWDEVVQCDGVGYGWDCDYCEKECVHKCQTGCGPGRHIRQSHTGGRQNGNKADDHALCDK